MTKAELDEKEKLSLDKFVGEIMETCIKPEYSIETVLDGLGFCAEFIRDERYARRFKPPLNS